MRSPAYYESLFQNVVVVFGLTELEIGLLRDMMTGTPLDDTFGDRVRFNAEKLSNARSPDYQRQVEREQLERSVRGSESQIDYVTIATQAGANWGDLTVERSDHKFPIKKVEAVPSSDVGADFELKPNGGYHHDSDNNPMCPHCHVSSQSQYLGTIAVDGMEQPAYKCGSCSRVYSKLPNHIKELAEAAKNQGAKTFSFKPAQETNVQHYNNGIAESPNYAEQQISSNTSMIAADMQQMISVLHDLTEKVSEIAQKNNELLDKMSKDPLASVRKSILDFELK